MKCKHQFFKTEDIIAGGEIIGDSRLGGVVLQNNYYHDGYEASCILCGELRRINKKGEISIFNKKKSIWYNP